MRGQAFTLEGIVASLLLLGALVVAIQVASMGPSTAVGGTGTADRPSAPDADSLLAVAAANRTIKPTLLYWNTSTERGPRHFHNNSTGTGVLGNYTTGPPTHFGRELNATFNTSGLAFNLNVYHLVEDTDRRERQRIVYQGQPGANAVTATRTVTLHDDDKIYNATRNSRIERESTVRLDEAESRFYAEDASSSGIYNVVVVEVVVWRS